VFSRRDGWHVTVLVYLIHRVDALLRQLYRINEFIDDPDCLLRLAMKQASILLSLSDGTRIMPGDPVGELHLWNDHLLHFPSGGPTLGWARRTHTLMVHSLSLLADHVATEQEWKGVQAFYADVPISPKRSPASVRAVCRRYGFEPALRHRIVWRSVHEVFESLLLCGLVYAHNRHRQKFLRHRQRIWIGRTTLIRRYGATNSTVALKPTYGECHLILGL
jgi:YkoP-like protein